MGKKTTKTKTQETATTTPNVPGIAQAPINNYYSEVGAFQKLDPYSMFTPSNDAQKQAFGLARNLSTGRGLYERAAGAYGRTMDAPTPFAGFGSAGKAELNPARQGQVGQLGRPAQMQGQGYNSPRLGESAYFNAGGYNAPRLGDAGQFGAANAGRSRDVALRGYNPSRLDGADAYEASQAGGGDPPGQAAQSKSASLLDGFDKYFSPATGNLVDTTLRGFDENAGRTRAAQAAAGARNGAFGGSRFGIAEAETERGLAQDRATTEAGLRNQAFSQASQLAQSDAGMRQQTGLANANAQNQRDSESAAMRADNNQFNAGQTNNARATNAEARNRFGLAGFAADNEASRFGADAANQGETFNAGEANRFGLANAGFQQEANAANTASRNQFALAGAGMEADASRFGADARNQAGQFNAGQRNQFGLAQAGMEADASRFGADAANQASQTNMAAQNQFGLSQFGAENDMSQFNAGEQNRFGLADFGAQNDMNQFNAGAYNQNQQFNSQQQLASQGQQMGAAAGMGSLAGQQSDQERANLDAMLDAGAQERGIDSAYDMLPLTNLMQEQGLMDPELLRIMTGQTTNSSGTSKTTEKENWAMYMAKMAQAAATAAAASDRRLKVDIEKLGEAPDGLGVYNYRYVTDDPEAPIRTGVMADEVAQFRPWALGPTRGGFATVHYSRLEG